MRIGLTTNARSVQIASAGRLLNATTSSAPPVSLDVANVRIEPRRLPAPFAPPIRNQESQIEVAGFATRRAAEQAATLIKSETGREPEIIQESATATWRVRAVAATPSRATVEELEARLEEKGLPAVVSVVSRPGNAQTTAARSSTPSPTASTPAGADAANPRVSSAATSRTSSGVRLASRSSGVNLPTRSTVVYAGNAQPPLLQSSAPVVFAADDEQNAPLRFNDKTYRGRLEVFTNLRGTLTVVNVINLEDYIRGVVPNELSSGGYAALEALKAQAIAARTYAVSNQGHFAAEGFDLLPTTRSQVYGGSSTEHPVATRAVDETRGIILTFNGEPINALYTSTCGGRTEHAEHIFGGAVVPYLRGRECGPEETGFAWFTISTSRELIKLREAAADIAGARDVALLGINNFTLPQRITDEWLAQPATVDEARSLLAAAARLARQPAPVVRPSDTALVRPPGFSTALALALDGESRADVLLDKADVDYLLAFPDADIIPTPNRADVALLVREGHLALYADATLRPSEPMPRGRLLRTLVRALESRALLALHKATVRPSTRGGIVVRPSGKAPDRTLSISDDAYLFRGFGEKLYPVRSLSVIGGEPVTFHTDARGRINYLEIRPAPNGAAFDRASPFTNWIKTMTPGEVAARLSSRTGSIGSLVDVRVQSRGVSRRALDLEIIGTNGTAHLRGGRIRSALGLREQLFVIDRQYDETGHITSFAFVGRGWGHGVGMCQVGAYGMARAGRNHESILRAYYSGVQLTKAY